MTNPGAFENQPGFIPPHGGYQKLKSYQMSELVYDATVKFCDRFIDPRSRTHDQMVQAARSGNKNIAEGSQVSGTSKKMELKLVGVARASLEELLGDYQDFLRQRGLGMWPKDHPMARTVPPRPSFSRNRTNPPKPVTPPHPSDSSNALPPKLGTAQPKPPNPS
ncbi:MAG: four helix bundle protein [Verrucomicrobia bacterium]|nr:four helix bundle protein [Verrucomicrobiota bacterium]